MTPGASSSSSSMSPARSPPCDEGLSRGVRNGGELAAPADPDVARFVGPVRAGARCPARSPAHTGSDPRSPRTDSAKLPVVAAVEELAAEDPTQRHKRHAFACLQCRMHRRQVASRTTISPFSAASLKRGARPASPSETALDSTSRTQPAPISRSAPSTGTPRSFRFLLLKNESPHDGHGRHRVIRRQREERAVGDQGR